MFNYEVQYSLKSTVVAFVFFYFCFYYFILMYEKIKIYYKE